MRADAVRVIAVLLVTGACTSGVEREGASEGDATPRGGTLRVAVPDRLASPEMDPQRYYNALALGRCCLFRTLYSYSGKPTEEGGAEPRPDLAVGLPEVSADGLTWTFRLRQGLRYAPPFEDMLITALDLVRALERTARVGEYSFYYEVIQGFEDYGSGAADSIGGLETPDELTLVVRLDQVTGDLAYLFSLPATSPIPEGATDGHDKDYARFLVASGPYMIEGSERLDFSLPPDEQEPVAGFVPPVLTKDGDVQEPGSLTLVRNPSWDPATDRLRAAYPDRIELILGAGDDEEIARRVDAAEVDLVLGDSSPYAQVARYRDDPALEDRAFVNPIGAFWSVTMNLAVPPFDDIHVRRAVALAIDKVALIELLSEPPHGPFGLSWGEVAAHMAPDALEGRLLRSYDPSSYDPDAARAKMQASGYDRDGDGRCDVPACRQVQTLVLDEGVMLDQARGISEDLAEVGIELALQTRTYDEGFFDLIHDPRERIAMGIAYPWSQDYPEGGGWFQGLFDRSGLEYANTSLLGAAPGQLRGWGYSVASVPSVDDRIQVCLARRGVARTECWAELDQYLMTEVVSRVPYMVTARAHVVSERVVAYSFDQFSGGPALDRIALAPGSD